MNPSICIDSRFAIASIVQKEYLTFILFYDHCNILIYFCTTSTDRFLMNMQINDSMILLAVPTMLRLKCSIDLTVLKQTYGVLELYHTYYYVEVDHFGHGLNREYSVLY